MKFSDLLNLKLVDDKVKTLSLKYMKTCAKYNVVYYKEDGIVKCGDWNDDTFEKYGCHYYIHIKT